MEQQSRLLDFQKPFELGSGSSNRISAVPSLIQRAEKHNSTWYNKDKNRCLDCNNLIWRTSIRCLSCSCKRMTYIRLKDKGKIDYTPVDYELEQVLLGSLLGDGCLRKRGQRQNSLFTEKHSIKQKEYFYWKVNYLSKILKLRIKEYDTKNVFKKYFKTYTILMMESNNLPILNRYYNLFYPNGKKVVTREILDKLEPLGLAVWYMDDGSYGYRDNCITISTQSFDKNEHIIIQRWFKEKWDIYCKIMERNDNSNHHFYIMIKDVQKFIDIISPHIQKSMNYKLGLDEEKLILTRMKNKEYENNRKGLPHRKALQKGYYLKNKEKILEYQKHYRILNSNKIKQYAKLYRKNNLIGLRKQNREYYQKNKEKYKYDPIYYSKNRERILKYRQLRREKNIRAIIG